MEIMGRARGFASFLVCSRISSRIRFAVPAIPSSMRSQRHEKTWLRSKPGMPKK